MRCLGGHFQGQLIYDPEVVQTGLIGESKEGNLARLRMGIEDANRVYNADELASAHTVCSLRHYPWNPNGSSVL